MGNSFYPKTYPRTLNKFRYPRYSLQVPPWFGQYIIVSELQEFPKETFVAYNLLARHAKNIDLVFTFRKLMTGYYFFSRDFNNTSRWSLWPMPFPAACYNY